MKITVRADHIANGARGSNCSCPIALAVKEVVGHTDVRVSNIAVEICDGRVHLPLAAVSFIRNFDTGHPNVQPFEFDLGGDAVTLEYTTPSK